jgi:hypothetical protein
MRPHAVLGKCGELLMSRLALFVAGTLIGLSGPGAADPNPTIAGQPETVFGSATQGCAPWDIPDTPARAWRGSDGTVRLVAGSEESRAMSGPRLGTLARDCRVLHRGAGADNPAAYDDRAWVHATYAQGTRVTALAHVEYHGHQRADRCAAGTYLACWRNAIVELRSADGGMTFHRAGLAAVLPYVYTGKEGRRSGYFNPSNILRRGDFLYAFVLAEAHAAQRRGACLLRRPVDGGPSDWRAWDGAGFSVTFTDPYRSEADPVRHVCTPVDGILSTISSVVESTAHGGYLAVTAATRPSGDGVPRSGIWWTTSTDLLHWSPPRLLWEVPLLWRRDCAAPAAFAYPSLLDDDSRSANFETVDDRFWLYLVRMPLGPHCRVGRARDLIRLPVSWPAPQDRGTARQ